jgi:hypothetical protein
MPLLRPIVAPEGTSWGETRCRDSWGWCRFSYWLAVDCVCAKSERLTRMFGAPQRASVQAATRSEWNKVSPPEIRCINDALRQHGARVETLIQRGVMPSDPKIHDIIITHAPRPRLGNQSRYYNLQWLHCRRQERRCDHKFQCQRAIVAIGRLFRRA